VRKVLVDNNTLDEGCIVKRSSDFTINLDELKVDVFTVKVGNGENSVNGDIGKFVVSNRDTEVSFTTPGRTYILDPREVLAVLCRLETSSRLNSI
jgi:hypothetical protein